MTKQGQIAGWIFDKDNLKNVMWTTFTKRDEDNNVYITFEPFSDILYALPNEQGEL